MPTETVSYIEAIGEALRSEMDANPDVFLIGEDVGQFGGAFKGPVSWPSSATRCRSVTGRPSSDREEGAVLRVGLTGGIGSGKSEVSRRLAARGAVIIDADVAARAVVAPGTPGLAQIAEAFGPVVLSPDGALDRERLGAIVFRDPALRAKLNAIVHPLVREWMATAEGAAADAARGDLIVVHDVPLLAESGRADGFDLVIVVDVPPELQVERLVSQRGMSPDQARARIAAQATRQQRLAVADLVIDNSGSLDDLERRVAEVWAYLERRAAR
jgi:dephospho-CoA kinase